MVRLLLSYTEINFDLALCLLCYITSIIDDRSEEFGTFSLSADKSSIPSMVYVWLKKYWFSRHIGHALFNSSLESTDLLTNPIFTSTETIVAEKEEYLHVIRNLNSEQTQIKYSSMQHLSKTIILLGELPSLSLEDTKQTVQILISYLTETSYATLLHVLLWLIANYQIASDDEKLWIQNTIHLMGE